MSQAYVNVLAEAGAAPFLIPQQLSVDVLRRLYDAADGVLLAGGRDVHPERYDSAPHPALGPTEQDRDEVELTFARWALGEGKPVLGVCRGMQLMNVAAGGTLIQDIASEVPASLTHDAPEGSPRDNRAHWVRLDPESRLAGLIGNTVHVNSFHHQAALRLAPSFHAVAWAPDHVVEAMESRNGAFAVGVQWHPEAFPKDEASQRLFAGFVAACAGT